MKKLMLFFGILFAANYAFAQNLKLTSDVPRYSSGSLVGIGSYSNQTNLGIMDISYSDLSNMLQDYNRNFSTYGSSGFQSILNTVSELNKDKNNMSREIEDLRNTIKQQERTIDELQKSMKEKDDALERLRRRIEDIEIKL